MQERSEDALTQANMSYSLERNTHNSEMDKLTAIMTSEKTEREKNDSLVSLFSLSCL